ncbi:hypothetical protein BU14_0075s0055 [Porphyra umbilicalis]|uniref:Uncharacterized protein n=1 Tax=Porphyra umbilicalis TaxID=2786 RepID=A0A1X6PFN5_PORUM|nr:hypothetical protein BU14_0075s0055 [Porphyra umbilicalis]|eukprot:OSX79565.1 hypothetical protein BU14_0075s0055 [Porphyra umbilicalis]
MAGRAPSRSAVDGEVRLRHGKALDRTRRVCVTASRPHAACVCVAYVCGNACATTMGRSARRVRMPQRAKYRSTRRVGARANGGAVTAACARRAVVPCSLGPRPRPLERAALPRRESAWRIQSRAPRTRQPPHLPPSLPPPVATHRRRWARASTRTGRPGGDDAPADTTSRRGARTTRWRCFRRYPAPPPPPPTPVVLHPRFRCCHGRCRPPAQDSPPPQPDRAGGRSTPARDASRTAGRPRPRRGGRRVLAAAQPGRRVAGARVVVGRQPAQPDLARPPAHSDGEGNGYSSLGSGALPSPPPPKPPQSTMRCCACRKQRAGAEGRRHTPSPAPTPPTLPGARPARAPLHCPAFTARYGGRGESVPVASDMLGPAAGPLREGPAARGFEGARDPANRPGCSVLGGQQDGGGVAVPAPRAFKVVGALGGVGRCLDGRKPVAAKTSGRRRQLVAADGRTPSRKHQSHAARQVRGRAGRPPPTIARPLIRRCASAPGSPPIGWKSQPLATIRGTVRRVRTGKRQEPTGSSRRPRVGCMMGPRTRVCLAARGGGTESCDGPARPSASGPLPLGSVAGGSGRCSWRRSHPSCRRRSGTSSSPRAPLRGRLIKQESPLCNYLVPDELPVGLPWRHRHGMRRRLCKRHRRLRDATVSCLTHCFRPPISLRRLHVPARAFLVPCGYGGGGYVVARHPGARLILRRLKLRVPRGLVVFEVCRALASGHRPVVHHRKAPEQLDLVAPPAAPPTRQCVRKGVGPPPSRCARDGGAEAAAAPIPHRGLWQRRVAVASDKRQVNSDGWLVRALLGIRQVNFRRPSIRDVKHKIQVCSTVYEHVI